MDEEQGSGGEKRVIVRVPQETWQNWDDKRQNLRTSFQRIGEELFTAWYTGAEPNTAGLTPEEEKYTRALLVVMRNNPNFFNQSIKLLLDAQVLPDIGDVDDDDQEASTEGIHSQRKQAAGRRHRR